MLCGATLNETGGLSKNSGGDSFEIFWESPEYKPPTDFKTLQGGWQFKGPAKQNAVQGTGFCIAGLNKDGGL